MRCTECHYPLDGLAAKRCPECGHAFDPSDPTTFAPSSRRRMLSVPHRAAIVFAAFGLWFVATMIDASANTSWEHHPFAGPFIIIKESLHEWHSPSDWALGLLIWGIFIAFPAHWIATGRAWSAIVAILLCVACLALSLIAAATANC